MTPAQMLAALAFLLAMPEAASGLYGYHPPVAPTTGPTTGDNLAAIGFLVGFFGALLPLFLGAPLDTKGKLRCITQPDAPQAALLDRLGIVLPKRMRFAEHERPALAASA